MKKLNLILLLFLLTLTLTGCFEKRELEDLAYVIAVGIDVGEKEKYAITYQIAVPIKIAGEGSDSAGKGSTTLITLETESIYNSISKVDSLISKELTLSHNKIIVCSEDLAKEGLDEILTSFITDREVRPKTSIIIHKGNAKEFLANLEPILEKNPARYYDLLLASSEYTGYSVDNSLFHFYLATQDKFSNAFAMLTENPTGETEENPIENSSGDNSTQASSQKDDAEVKEKQNSSQTTESSNEGKSSPQDENTSDKENTSSQDEKSASSQTEDSTQDKNSSSQDKDSSSQDKDSSSQDKDSSSQDKDSSSQDKDSSSQDKDSSSQDKDSSSQDKDSSSQDKNSSSQDKGSSSQDKDSSSQDKDSSSQSDDSSNKGESSDEQSMPKTANFAGIAVFKNDIMVGEIRDEQIISHLILQGHLKKVNINIEDIKDKNKITIVKLLQTQTPNIKISITDHVPNIAIDIPLHAELITSGSPINYNENENRTKLGKAIEDKVKNDIEIYLQKIAKEYQSDIIGFGKYVRTTVVTLDELNQIDWEAIFPKSKFQVNVRIHLDTNQMITNELVSK